MKPTVLAPVISPASGHVGGLSLRCSGAEAACAPRDGKLVLTHKRPVSAAVLPARRALSSSADRELAARFSLGGTQRARPPTRPPAPQGPRGPLPLPGQPEPRAPARGGAPYGLRAPGPPGLLTSTCEYLFPAQGRPRPVPEWEPLTRDPRRRTPASSSDPWARVTTAPHSQQAAGPSGWDPARCRGRGSSGTRAEATHVYITQECVPVRTLFTQC